MLRRGAALPAEHLTGDLGWGAALFGGISLPAVPHRFCPLPRSARTGAISYLVVAGLDPATQAPHVSDPLFRHGAEPSLGLPGLRLAMTKKMKADHASAGRRSRIVQAGWRGWPP